MFEFGGMLDPLMPLTSRFPMPHSSMCGSTTQTPRIAGRFRPWMVTLNDIDLDEFTAIYYREPSRLVFSPEILDPYLSWWTGQAQSKW